MEITWYGHSCFRLVERGLATLVMDPYDESIGYGQLRLSADLVTISHDAPGHGYASAVSHPSHVIARPGEYEIGGVFITGLATGSRRAGAKPNTLFVVDFGGLKIAHLGDLDHVLSQTQFEDLGAVHIALVPVGGGGGLNASQAAEVVAMLEPSIVIPMHYRTEYTTLSLDPVGKFFKEMGVASPSPESALKVSKSSLPDETRLVLLDPKTT
jgi:L-ascorbate metabolism protein UlaG (beta-lactamase superfamily)